MSGCVFSGHYEDTLCFGSLVGATHQQRVELSGVVGEESGRLLAQLTHLRDLDGRSRAFISRALVENRAAAKRAERTSCNAVALWPVTSRHMMMCSSRMT